jgi:hypothetical protein
MGESEVVHISKIPAWEPPAREENWGNDIWVWRYRLNGTMKQETRDAVKYMTKTAMWQ